MFLLIAVCHKVIPSGKLEDEHYCMHAGIMFAHCISVAAVGLLACYQYFSALLLNLLIQHILSHLSVAYVFNIRS